MMRLQRGLGMITAIIVLVIMAALASAMTMFGSTQQLTSAQDVMAVKAWQAAKAGNEWGLYMALTAGTGWAGGSACTPSDAAGVAGTERTKTIVLADLGFSASVTCSATFFNEGEDPARPGSPLPITLYTITSTATNGVSVESAGYIERSRVVIATKID